MSEPGLVGQAVIAAIQAGEPIPADSGAVALALRYSALIDAAGEGPESRLVVSDLGPKLLQCLTSLGLTLAGRKVTPGRGEENDSSTGASSALDELRERRRSRAH